MKVLITGAGIGGLTLAVALKRAGLEVEVFERAPRLEAAGAGLMLQINAMRALRGLGLDTVVAPAGVPLERAVIRARSGRELQALPIRALSESLGAPMIAIHRAELQRLLLEALGEAPLHLGAAALGFDADATGVTLRLADGATARGDVLVGADGLRSAIRAQLHPGEALRYAGYTSWRGIARQARALVGSEANESWGPGQRFGWAPVDAERVYWYATADAPAGGSDGPAPLEELAARFAGWHTPIAALLAATPETAVLRTDIHDRAPLAHWRHGRVTLLGDAAHPMTPNLGQGACQAIEDAVVLADRLAREAGPERALEAYEIARRERANGFVERSSRFGALAQQRHPWVCAARDTLMRLTPASALRAPLLEAYDFRLDG